SSRYPLIFLSFIATSTTAIYTLSLHDALPIYDILFEAQRFLPHLSPHRPGCENIHHEAASRYGRNAVQPVSESGKPDPDAGLPRSEEHTSELQSRENLVCRLLLEKKKHNTQNQ